VSIFVTFRCERANLENMMTFCDIFKTTGPSRRLNDYLSLRALAITSEEHNEQLNECQTHFTAATLLPSTDLTSIPSRRCIPVIETATTLFPEIQNSLFLTECHMHVIQDAILYNYLAYFIHSCSQAEWSGSHTQEFKD